MSVTPKTKPIRPGTVPQGATHYQVYKLTRGEGTRPNGGKYRTWRGKRLEGDPDPRSGKVAHQWPLSDFDPAKVRRRWGSGRFRVRFVTETGDLLGSEDMTLETPAGEVTGDALEAPEVEGGGASSSPASRLRGMAGRTLDGGGVLEIMMLMQDAGDRAAARARAEAEANAERDRQFFAQLQAQQQQTIALLTGAGGGAAAVVGGPRRVVGLSRKGLARELKLLKRELALEQREELARIREELADQEPDDEPAKTAGEAAEKAGIAAVEGLGEHMPAVVGELLGGLRAWLKSKGQPTDPATMARAIQAVQRAHELEAQQNGGGHGSIPQ